jgi:small subunit ribosomal protein S16
LRYWLGVGAKPSENVAVLIKKYGPEGTHKQAQTSARAKLAAPKAIPDPGAPKYAPTPKEQAAAAQTEGHPAAGAEQTEPVEPSSRAPEQQAEQAAEVAAARAEKHEMQEPNQSAGETA